MRFNRKNPRAHLFADFANILIIGASQFETFNDAGLHPLTYIMPSQFKTLDCSLSASLDITPQQFICPFFRNGGDVFYANPRRIVMWACPNNNGFAAVRA